MKGILLIAVGHKDYVGMAITLATSLKFNDPAIKIALATDKPIAAELNDLFDEYVHVPEEYYKVGNSTQFIKAKTHMYDLSPFQETIFLDVDMIMLMNRKISILFEELKDIDWTIANTGKSDVTIWADGVENIKKAYKTEGDFWNFHSEFVYFKKNATVKKYFDRVKKIFNNPKGNVVKFSGGNMADELAFQIASMQLDYYPHAENFLPTFWHARRKHSNLYPYQLPQTYFSYSIGGNHLPPAVRINYNNLASFYFKKLNLQRPYQARDKKAWLPERAKI